MSPPISRVTRSKAAARANYNRLANWYDALAGSEAKYRRLGMQALAAQPGEAILELGCGTGGCLVEFAQAVGAAGLTCGIDLSDGMLAQARQRVQRAGLPEPVLLGLADAVHLPFRAASFSAIFMSFTLELIDTPEIPRVLKECRRVLQPAGRLALVTMLQSADPGLPERLYEWCHARMPVLVDCRPIRAQPLLLASGFSLRSTQTLSMWGLPVEILLADRA